MKKRHIENYFLDPEILFNVAEKLYLTAITPSLTKEFIEVETKRIAEESLNFNLLKNTKEYLGLNHFFKIPTVKSIDKKSIADIKTEIMSGVKNSIGVLSTGLDETTFTAWLDNEELRLKELLKSDAWKDEFQGKIIFTKLCAEILKDDHLRIRQAYVDLALIDKPILFDDIIDFFKEFA